MSTPTTAIHPFERRGLGLAPFQVVGCEERRGPMAMRLASGVEVQVGAPGQPMGTCDFCGTGIAECWAIRSADGKRFIVGCECVRKTGDRALTSTVNREINKRRKVAEAKRVAAVRARLIASTVGDEPDHRLHDSLRALPSPNKFRAGESALDWATWMLRHSGHSGSMKVVRFVEKVEGAMAPETSLDLAEIGR